MNHVDGEKALVNKAVKVYEESLYIKHQEHIKG